VEKPNTERLLEELAAFAQKNPGTDIAALTAAFGSSSKTIKFSIGR